MDIVHNNRSAAFETVNALEALGRLEQIDTALVTGFVRIAEALDVDPGNAALWRAYAQAEERLRSVGAPSSDADAASGFLERLRESMQDGAG